MPFIPLLLVLVLIFVVITAVIILKRVYSRRIVLLPQRKEIGAPTTSFRFISFDEVQETLDHPEVERKWMRGMKEHGVASIYLVHGTFVGEDPFHISSLLERSFPSLSPNFVSNVREKIKQGQNLLAKDIGNFTEDHVRFLSDSLDCKVHNFTWSSGNHHFARVEGCVHLVQQLAKNHNPKDRVLLIGHSHAGQIFALLTKLFFDEDFRIEIEQMFPEIQLSKYLIKIQHFNFDIVTLGAPPRYQWSLAKNMRLLHIINHRGQDLLGGGFRDATFTKKGDYIQQWGLSGSDMKSTDLHIQAYNEKLDLFLGKGHDLEKLRSEIRVKKRLHNQGFHLLTDYGDQSKLPNFFKTIFGHGVYTRMRYMPFMLEKVREHFYQSPPDV